MVKEIEKCFKFVIKEKKIVILGTKPKFPHTGYGYIKKSHEISLNFYDVEQFIEKPDLKMAQHYFKNENFEHKCAFLAEKH